MIIGKMKTPIIKAYDKADRVLGKGILLASSVPITIGEGLVEMVRKKKLTKKGFQKASEEIKRRLNKGEGRGRHFAGTEI